MSSQDEGIVDVERRKNQVEYTLGDPTVFPPEFLVWLKRFIEQSGITLPASAIFGSLVPGGGSGSLRNIAAGVIVPFAGPVPPAGSIACNGQLELINDYPKLHEIIGAVWGPQTATTFTVPDLRDRTLFGAGSALALAATEGLPIGQRGPSHHHGVSLATDAKGGHGHTGSVGAGGGHSHGGGVDGGGGHGHNFSRADPIFVQRQGGTAGVFFTPVDNISYAAQGVAGDGSHSHGLHIDGVGDHGHGLTINAVGDHTHTAAGNSTGGVGADAPAHAGINYVITTG